MRAYGHAGPVVAEASKRVVGADRRLESWSEHFEDAISGCVTLAVVDALEVVVHNAVGVDRYARATLDRPSAHPATRLAAGREPHGASVG